MSHCPKPCRCCGFGLFASKLALLGNRDAIETVSWFKDVLFPGTVPEDRENDPFAMNEDIKVMKDPRFLDIFQEIKE